MSIVGSMIYMFLEMREKKEALQTKKSPTGFAPKSKSVTNVYGTESLRSPTTPTHTPDLLFLLVQVHTLFVCC